LKLFIAGKCNKVRGLEYLKGLGEFVDRLRTDLNNNERLSVISEYSTISNLAERDVAVIAGRIDPVLLDSSDRRSLLEFIRRLERPELETTEPGFIYLTTIHGAKGLEADLVLIPGFEQQVIPDGFEINEQRRLIYVGLTRTKESLRFTRSDYREPNGFRLKNDTWEYSNRRPSQFVIEMEAPNITGL
jgi:superfamily I DNA/RNA helicase